MGSKKPSDTLPRMPQATAEQLHRLLDLQAEDTAIKRLETRRASLPEQARLEEIKARLQELEADLEIATKQNEEIQRERNRLEGDIQLVAQKISKEEQRLLSGKVSNPKELGALQAEVASLNNKRGGLEDELLEVMVQQDDAVATKESLSGERATAASESETLSSTLTGLLDDIDAEMTTHAQARSTIAEEVPGDLLQLYEKIRAEKSGVGVAALEAGTCLGCHTKLPAVEVERIRSEGGLQRCDNCRRILVV
jgi:predicted  nucleic acid-binding Zn-ribbon protein